jgi:putative peptidoglycan lipid II flippase
MTVTLTRVLFPFLLLVGLWAYAMAVLNSLGHFAAPSLGPCLLNLSMILCASQFGENVFGLAMGVLAGGCLQFLIQLPPLYLKGWKAAFTAQFRHPEAKKIGVLLIPRAVGACVYQINVFISTILASLSTVVGEGAVAALYYANRIWQLPLAIFGIALAQAALPAMSRHAALNEMEKLKKTLLFSMRALFFILVPASIGLMVLSAPITRLLFERGAFTGYSTRITAAALFYYAAGLLACGGIKVLVSAF